MTTPAQSLAAALAPVLDVAVSVLEAPSDVIVPPAVVIRPADPYQAPAMTGNTQGASYRYDVDLILHRQDERKGLRLLEYGRHQIAEALPSGWWWVTFGNIGNLEVAGKTYLRATLTVATILTDAP